MFTGKKPTDDRFKDDLSLHGYVKAALPERVMEIFDHVILEYIVGEDQINTNTVTNHTNYLLRTGKSRRMLDAVSALLGIALSCSVEYPWERMDMRDVVAELSTIRNKLLGTHLPRHRQIPAGAPSYGFGNKQTDVLGHSCEREMSSLQMLSLPKRQKLNYVVKSDSKDIK